MLPQLSVLNLRCFQSSRCDCWCGWDVRKGKEEVREDNNMLIDSGDSLEEDENINTSADRYFSLLEVDRKGC